MTTHKNHQGSKKKMPMGSMDKMMRDMMKDMPKKHKSEHKKGM